MKISCQDDSLLTLSLMPLTETLPWFPNDLRVKHKPLLRLQPDCPSCSPPSPCLPILQIPSATELPGLSKHKEGGPGDAPARPRGKHVGMRSEDAGQDSTGNTTVQLLGATLLTQCDSLKDTVRVICKPGAQLEATLR